MYGGNRERVCVDGMDDGEVPRRVGGFERCDRGIGGGRADSGIEACGGALRGRGEGVVESCFRLGLARCFSRDKEGHRDEQQDNPAQREYNGAGPFPNSAPIVNLQGVLVPSHEQGRPH